ncbi:MAG: flagellar protein export ATPase FliI [Lachnospiraceae bacterium]|nr:flagellar protein export ATPase FliI [Lachnospiraceae bacterium]
MNENFTTEVGKVMKVVGLTIESAGPSSKLNDLCVITSKDGRQKVNAEVVGFRDNRILLMPFDAVGGIGVGATVENTGKPFQVYVGPELLGKVLDGIGQPMDGTKLILPDTYPVECEPPDPMKRKIISEVLPLGVKAVDGLLTIGKGQRIGIFAGSGVGKSTLLGMFARNTKADINVIALIGERGREVGEFIERDLGPEGMQRSVLVVATSDKPALIRNKAAKTATAIAEYFRDQGRDVLLMMDSLTRFSMAQREIGLASGEPPITRGYPPSVYSEMPKLLERAGNTETGSITGLYTVLVDGDDFNEPITDTARGILDGHIMLSRKLGHKNHYPAIDVLQSISRCMSQIASKEHKQVASRLKTVLATYNEAEDLINIGAYKAGSNPEIDYAIRKIKDVNGFLCQDVDSKYLFDDEIEQLESIFTD